MNLENIALINVDLPDCTADLDRIEEYIKTLCNRFKDFKNKDEFTKKAYNDIDNYIVETLILLGELSVPAFDAVDELEKKYVLAYPNSPGIAKKLWLEHGDIIHYRFDLLKNRCYRLIDDMNDELVRLNIKL